MLKVSRLASKQPIPPLPSVAAAQDLWRRGGFSGLTRGIGISTVGAALHSGLVFMAYFSLRSWWPSTPERSVLPAALVCGTLAGTFAQLTYPFDVVRKTAVLENLHAFDTVHMLVRQGGVLGLYKGAVANVVKVAPFFAIQFCIFEAIVGANWRAKNKE